MNNISGALNDIKKYYDIKEIKNLEVKFGKTTIIRFASVSYTHLTLPTTG